MAMYCIPDTLHNVVRSCLCQCTPSNDDAFINYICCKSKILRKLLILCLHPRYWGSILPGTNVTATVAVCCLPCLFSWKTRLFSLFVCVAVGVTVGVRASKVGRWFSRWFGNLIFKFSLGDLSWGHSDASYHFFRDEVSHLDRYTLQRCTYIL